VKVAQSALEYTRQWRHDAINYSRAALTFPGASLTRQRTMSAAARATRKTTVCKKVKKHKKVLLIKFFIITFQFYVPMSSFLSGISERGFLYIGCFEILKTWSMLQKINFKNRNKKTPFLFYML
jgi:hypothetical protein